MTETGLVDVPDASALFLTDRRPGTPGSVVTPVLEGARPLLVEVQALVAPTEAPLPRRSGQGLDTGRLAMLLAVLDRRAGVSVSRADVYASIAGGVRVSEAAADLAIALAVAGSHTNVAVAEGTVALGELGLGGEVRQVPRAARRLAEASRLGFTRALVPESSPTVDGIEVVRVSDLRHALAAAFAAGTPRRAAA
jgi:DNA repair protein RadA/Sms